MVLVVLSGIFGGKKLHFKVHGARTIADLNSFVVSNTNTYPECSGVTEFQYLWGGKLLSDPTADLTSLSIKMYNGCAVQVCVPKAGKPSTIGKGEVTSWSRTSNSKDDPLVALPSTELTLGCNYDVPQPPNGTVSFLSWSESVSASGRRLLAGSWDGTARIWEVQLSTAHSIPMAGLNHASPVLAGTWVTNDEGVVVTASGNACYCWNTQALASAISVLIVYRQTRHVKWPDTMILSLQRYGCLLSICSALLL